MTDIPDEVVEKPRLSTHGWQDCGGMIVADVGDGAQMSIPSGDLEWQLRYGSPEKVRYVAASVIESYAYLIADCSQNEALRRLRIMKKARKSAVYEAVKDKAT